jgi:integrase
MAGSVRKRGKKWYYSFEAATVDGKRKRIERVGGRTKKEAEKALRKAIEEYEQTGEHHDPSQISISDYLHYWYEKHVMINCRYNTQVNYKRIIDQHLIPLIGNLKIRSITPDALQNVINTKYSEGISKNYLTNMFGVLSGAMKYAVHPCKYLKENPMQYVKIPKYDGKVVSESEKIIAYNDFQRIIERFPERTHFHICLMIGYHTGLRSGEVMALTWDDIDFDNKTLTVSKTLSCIDKHWCFGPTKTRSSERTIRIGDTLINALKIQKNWQNENKLKYGQYFTKQYVEDVDIPNRQIHSLEATIPPPDSAIEISMVSTKENGQMLTTDSLKYISRVINKDLGIDYKFHRLRHTHATILMEESANDKGTQERLGHAKLSTTKDTYSHVTKRIEDETVDKFEQALKRKHT